MGVSACIYCNCFERGLVASQPKSEWNVFVDGGDSVPMELMPQLREEVSKLFKVRCNEPRAEAFLRGFEKTMQALCMNAETLDRPICF